jgi:hypothetical protein
VLTPDLISSAEPAAPPANEAVSLTVLASSCSSGTCPTLYRTDRGTVVVQGYAVTAMAAGIDLPDGELLVEIPLDLLAQVQGKIDRPGSP